MKQLLLLCALVFSVNSFALEASGNIMNAAEFDQMMSTELEMKSTQYNPYRYSSTTCYAATRCPNGRVIRCQVYGYNYSAVPSHMSNSCRWAVWPGRAVRCKGYTRQTDYYGRTFWSYVDIPVSCY